MLGSFAPTKGATLLFLAPSVAGSYGTYKTLTDQSGVFGNTFAQSCTKFYDAMDHEANPRHPSTIIRAFFINFGKHFKSHEKLAMIGSASAVLVGTVLIPVGIIGSLLYFYKYLKANEYEKKKHKKQAMNMINLSLIGGLSLTVGVASGMLLADYRLANAS